MTTLTEAEATAYRASVRESPARMARWCLDNLGQRVSAASLGLADASLMRRYARRQGKPSGDREASLRLLYRVGRMMTDAYDAQTARAFLRSSNPLLGDRAPVAVISTEAAETAGAEVLTAARALLLDDDRNLAIGWPTPASATTTRGSPDHGCAGPTEGIALMEPASGAAGRAERDRPWQRVR